MMKQLRFSGSGGQGVITAAIIFAEAAVMEGKYAVQSQSYGPEARGGASKAEVIISDEPVWHPHVEVPDVVLAMTQKAADKYYKDMMDSKGLSCELVTEFRYVLVTSENSPLASLDDIGFSDLSELVEIAHADPYVPSLPLSEVKKEELPEMEKRIFVFERASQFELLSKNPNTFMWASPIPQSLLRRFGLVQKNCSENHKVYKDLIIYKKDYHLTELDRAFLTELCRVKRELFAGR